MFIREEGVDIAAIAGSESNLFLGRFLNQIRMMAV